MDKSLKLLLIVAFCLPLHAQILAGVLNPKAPVTSTSVTVSLGGTSTALESLFYDGGNQNVGNCNPFTAPSSGTVNVTIGGAVIGTGGTGQIGFAVYTSSAGAANVPVSGATFIGGSSTYTAGSAYTHTFSGVTVTGGTSYFSCAAMSWTNAGLAGSNDTGSNSCSQGGMTSFSNLASFPTSWDNPMPAPFFVGTNVCETVYTSLTYPSSGTWFVNQSGQSPNYASSSPLTSTIVPVGTNHVLVTGIVVYNEFPSGASITGFTDSASDSSTERLGNCAEITISFEYCVYTIDSLSAGANSIIVTVPDVTTFHALFEPVEIQKAGGTPTYDTGVADTSGQSSSFTGPNLTTSQANELVLCFVQNDNLVNQDTSNPWTAGAGWTQLGWGQPAGSGGPTDYDAAVFYQIAATAGNYPCKGSYSGTASVFTATVAYK